MLKEIALDLKRYDTPEKLGSLVNDTASLAIEASETGIPRVNPSYFVKHGESHVIAPGRDKRDILKMFAVDTPDTEAAKKIKDMLLNDTKNDAYVWISPADPYPESRIQVGVKKITKSGRSTYMKRYDISTTLSPRDCLYLGQMLVSISKDNVDFPINPNDLRSIIIKLKIPADQNPFEYLSKLIELPEKDRWKSILDGTADKNKAKAVKAAVIATAPVRLNPHVIYSAPAEYGAYVETQMRNEGYGMDPEKFGCGGSNTTFVSSGSSYTETVTPALGFEDQYGSLSFTCPKCGATNIRPSGQLLSVCQHCGGDVRC